PRGGPRRHRPPTAAARPREAPPARSSGDDPCSALPPAGSGSVRAQDRPHPMMPACAGQATSLQSRLMRELYPSLEPYQQGYLKVSDLHELYYEQSGNPDGQPVLFVHGGPGGGTEPFQRQFFDPAAYRIVLFDQRGCGKSRPHACLEENPTRHLVDDMARLRREL